MKQITILFIVATLLVTGCKSKPKEQAKDPGTDEATTAETEPEAEPEPDQEPEPEPPPPPKPLTDVKTSCEKDTDCVLTTLISEGPRICCVSCETKAVAAEWLADSIRTCTENATTKSIKCPPQKCEASEFLSARCVSGTCEPSKEPPKAGPLGTPMGGSK